MAGDDTQLSSADNNTSLQLLATQQPAAPTSEQVIYLSSIVTHPRQSFSITLKLLLNLYLLK